MLALAWQKVVSLFRKRGVAATVGAMEPARVTTENVHEPLVIHSEPDGCYELAKQRELMMHGAGCECPPCKKAVRDGVRYAKGVIDARYAPFEKASGISMPPVVDEAPPWWTADQRFCANCGRTWTGQRYSRQPKCDFCGGMRACSGDAIPFAPVRSGPLPTHRYRFAFTPEADEVQSDSTVQLNAALRTFVTRVEKGTLPPGQVPEDPKLPAPPRCVHGTNPPSACFHCSRVVLQTREDA